MTMTLEEQASEIVAATVKGPLRVAFIGAAGSGKTTHAKLMQKKYKGDVLSFASPLKKILRELFGAQMDDPQFAREAAQLIGTDAVRKLDPTTWIRMLTEKIPVSRNCYVDDVRFPNEYYALKRLGFCFVRLDAYPETLVRRRPSLTKEQAAHESEQHQLYFTADITVSSDPVGALAQFHETYPDDAPRPTLAQALTRIPDTEEDIQETHDSIVRKLKLLDVLD